MSVKLLFKYYLKLISIMKPEELNGIVWHSPINSTMTFEADGATGNLIGKYHSAVIDLSAPMIGRFNPTGPGAFGWTVSWPPSQKYPTTSETSWVANMAVIKGKVTIESSWMIREQLGTNPYYSTVSGSENYTIEPSSPEVVEAHKHVRPPHPL